MTRSGHILVDDCASLEDCTINSKQTRKQALSVWANENLQKYDLNSDAGFELEAISDDASFRRYFRVKDEAFAFIFVDAPPAHEDSESFVKIANLISSIDVCVPTVLEFDLVQGFMMLSDLGDQLFLDVLQLNDRTQTQSLYQSAIETLDAFRELSCENLPAYNDELLRLEMGLFPEWFLAEQLSLKLNSAEQDMLADVFDKMVSNALNQPQAFVHRDFHCRNLMVVSKNGPGVIDFQDAVQGPITYDLASLLKDCYWQFPRKEVEKWVKVYWQSLQSANGFGDIDIGYTEFLKWFDLMGMQRHLKCAGIFSRLNLRDGKAGYLKDIPLVIAYIKEVCEIYEEFQDFGAWLEKDIQPLMKTKLSAF